jgi:hypothetical protein
MPLNKSFLVVALFASSLAACDRYMDRRDQVTFGTGDAIAANKAAQIIDPWPVSARTIQHGMTGEQAEEALERMRRASEKSNAPDKAGAPRIGPALPPAPPGLNK